MIEPQAVGLPGLQPPKRQAVGLLENIGVLHPYADQPGDVEKAPVVRGRRIVDDAAFAGLPVDIEEPSPGALLAHLQNLVPPRVRRVGGHVVRHDVHQST